VIQLVCVGLRVLFWNHNDHVVELASRGKVALRVVAGVDPEGNITRALHSEAGFLWRVQKRTQVCRVACVQAGEEP
jgi:hypothetical protein